ncbi:MAG: helix-turn-helix domain-containing protein [Vicinamibacterales bacterium]
MPPPQPGQSKRSRACKSHINRLRAKIERNPAVPEFILTVWSVG